MISVVDSGRRAVAYDRRGHGRSDDPGRGYDHDTLADDLASVLERLDLQDVTLIAHSMGSGEAVRYLTRHGDGRVARLLLLAPTTPFVLKTSDNEDGVDAQLFAERRHEWRRDFGEWILENEARAGTSCTTQVPACARPGKRVLRAAGTKASCPYADLEAYSGDASRILSSRHNP